MADTHDNMKTAGVKPGTSLLQADLSNQKTTMAYTGLANVSCII